MIMLLLGLQKAPTTFDASDAVAVAICHLHSRPAADLVAASLDPGDGDTGSKVRLKPDSTRRGAAPGSRIPRPGSPVRKSWRQYRPPSTG
jgi:hypothetical protein